MQYMYVFLEGLLWPKNSPHTMQMAARDTGFGAVEGLLHEGKLLALDLLYHILENPLHSWNNVRAEVGCSLSEEMASSCSSNEMWPAHFCNQAHIHQQALLFKNSHNFSLTLQRPR